MTSLTFIPRYFLWHYSVALVDFARAVSNVLWCTAHFFSLELLARSFFVPWRRLGETQGGFFGRFIVNGMMRVVGVLARLGVFALAAVSLVLLFGATLVGFVFWLVLPFVVVLLLAVGIRSVFAL